MISSRRFSINMEADIKISDSILATMIRRALHKEGLFAKVKILRGDPPVEKTRIRAVDRK